MKLEVELDLIGYVFNFWCEELGYDFYFVIKEDYNKEIEKIKKEASELESDSNSTTISIDEVYCSDNFFGKEPDEYSLEINVDCKVFIKHNVKEVEIPFSKKSIEFNLMIEKLDSEEINCCKNSFDDTRLYKINDVYLIYRNDQLYRIIINL